MTENIRKLVRPTVTFVVVGTFVKVLFNLISEHGDLEMTKIVLAAFIALVSSITGFWFGSRITGGQ